MLAFPSTELIAQPIGPFAFIGASLSEPHSYVLTRTFAIRDIYIYINRASDRLALCPRRSDQNPAQIPYFDFAFAWL